MKPLCLLLSTGLVIATASSTAHAQEYVYMLSAGEMSRMIAQDDKKMVVGYIAGVMDTMMRSHDFCVPEGTAPGVIGAKVYAMMGQQPRESMAPAADVITVFLHGDYPCRK